MTHAAEYLLYAVSLSPNTCIILHPQTNKRYRVDQYKNDQLDFV